MQEWMQAFIHEGAWLSRGVPGGVQKGRKGIFVMQTNHQPFFKDDFKSSASSDAVLAYTDRSPITIIKFSPPRGETSDQWHFLSFPVIV